MHKPGCLLKIKKHLNYQITDFIILHYILIMCLYTLYIFFSNSNKVLVVVSTIAVGLLVAVIVTSRNHLKKLKIDFFFYKKIFSRKGVLLSQANTTKTCTSSACISAGTKILLFFLSTVCLNVAKLFAFLFCYES